MSRVIKLEALNLEKSWNSIIKKLNIKWRNWGGKLWSYKRFLKNSNSKNKNQNYYYNYHYYYCHYYYCCCCCCCCCWRQNRFFYHQKPLHTPHKMCGSSNALTLTLHASSVFQLKNYYFKGELHYCLQINNKTWEKRLKCR